jgi:hypothetical protein
MGLPKYVPSINSDHKVYPPYSNSDVPALEFSHSTGGYEPTVLGQLGSSGQTKAEFMGLPSLGWVFICPDFSGQITFRPLTHVYTVCSTAVSLEVGSLSLLPQLNDIVCSEFFCLFS